MAKNALLGLGILIGTAGMAQAATGLYAGAALGGADTRLDHTTFDIRDTDGGWKLFAGYRPLGLFGAEVGYLDFGRATNDGSHSETRGFDALALAYLPIPLLDIYGKLGLIGWRQGTQSQALAFDRSGTGLAYGAGAGTHFGALGIRVEYERFAVSDASRLSLTSLGISWNFL